MFVILILFLYFELQQVSLGEYKDYSTLYRYVVNEMYEDNVLEDDDIEELDLSKEKDDFER